MSGRWLVARARQHPVALAIVVGLASVHLTWAAAVAGCPMMTITECVTAAVTSSGLAIGLATLVTAIQLQVRVVEEPYLLRTHGKQYRHYGAQVGRFLPGIGQLRVTSENTAP